MVGVDVWLIVFEESICKLINCIWMHSIEMSLYIMDVCVWGGGCLMLS